jgi:hypothetical protein
MATTKLCPICIENEATCVTECNHYYCITCLCKIKKCALCRKDLVRSQICKEIISKIRVFDEQEKSYFNFVQPQGHVYPPTEGINYYSFSILTRITT